MQIFRSAALAALAAVAGLTGAALISAAAVVLLRTEIGTAFALAAVGGFWLMLAALVLFLLADKATPPAASLHKRPVPYGTLLTAAAAGIALGRGMPDEAARLLAHLDYTRR